MWKYIYTYKTLVIFLLIKMFKTVVFYFRNIHCVFFSSQPSQCIFLFHLKRLHFLPKIDESKEYTISLNCIVGQSVISK